MAVDKFPVKKNFFKYNNDKIYVITHRFQTFVSIDCMLSDVDGSTHFLLSKLGQCFSNL